MKPTYLTGAILIIALAGVGFYTHYNKTGSAGVPDDMGAYSYTCTDGSAFSMVPSNDMSSIRVIPGSGMAFDEATIIQKDSHTYGTGALSLYGVGEHIRLYTVNATYECDPVPNSEMAPFNWGDPA